MSAQKGKNLLLKLDATGTGMVTTVAGLRARAIAFNAETVDVTSQESAGQWRELLDGAGLRNARITGSGVFRDEASDEAIRATFFAGAIRAWQVVIPDFGIVAGPFQITTLEFSGRHDAELTFDLTLESAGQLTFTAA
jgi:TP901-1 family phage major tail protein